MLDPEIGSWRRLGRRTLFSGQAEREAMMNEGATMHGEHKTPGGKLVVVDLDRVDERLRNVEVSGDFFLYPDDLLAAITGSLEGLDATLDQEAIADHVRRAVPEGAEMLGTSPQGIAIAVRRALQERDA